MESSFKLNKKTPWLKVAHTLARNPLNPDRAPTTASEDTAYQILMEWETTEIPEYKQNVLEEERNRLLGLWRHREQLKKNKLIEKRTKKELEERLERIIKKPLPVGT